MARLDWEGARSRDRARAAARKSASRKPSRERALALEGFVEKHGLACFKCGETDAEWAKTGISARGPWAICAPCVKHKSG